MRILVINGPNINMLGIREPGIYGTQNYQALLELIARTAISYNAEVECFQSNHEGDLVGDIEGTFNISSSLDGLTSICINDDPQYYKEPTAVVYKSEWLTEADAPFLFRFEPTGSETRYRVYCDKQGTDMCLEFDEATKNLYVRKKSDSKNQLFRIVYVSYNRYLLQAYNEDVVGYDLKDDGTGTYTMIVGEEELQRGVAQLKDLEKQEQKEISRRKSCSCQR